MFRPRIADTTFNIMSSFLNACCCISLIRTGEVTSPVWTLARLPQCPPQVSLSETLFNLTFSSTHNRETIVSSICAFSFRHHDSSPAAAGRHQGGGRPGGLLHRKGTYYADFKGTYYADSRADSGPTFTQRNDHTDALTQS